MTLAAAEHCRRQLSLHLPDIEVYITRNTNKRKLNVFQFLRVLMAERSSTLSSRDAKQAMKVRRSSDHLEKIVGYGSYFSAGSDKDPSI